MAQSNLVPGPRGPQGKPGDVNPENFEARDASIAASVEAGQQAIAARTAKTDAETARLAALAARTNAETARTGAETARGGSESAASQSAAQAVAATQSRVATERARDQAQNAVATGRVQKDFFEDAGAVAGLGSSLAYPEGAQGEVFFGAGAGLYVKAGASGAGAWEKKSGATVTALATTKADRSVIDQNAAGDGLDLLSAGRRRFARLLASGDILFRWLQQTADTGGFSIRDVARRQPFAVMDGGVRIAGLTISGAGSGLLVMTSARRLIARLDGSGLTLGGYPTLAKVIALIDGRIAAAAPAPQVGAPILGPHIFHVTGMRHAINARNIQPARQDGAQSVLTLGSEPVRPKPPLIVSSREILTFEGDRLGTAAILTCRELGKTTMLRRAMTVRSKVVPLSGAPERRIFMIGDSTMNLQMPQFVSDFLVGHGITPKLMGSVPSSRDGQPSNGDGPLAEGRNGWASPDFFGVDTDEDVVGVIAPGDEPAYLALDKVERTKRNPFLRRPTASDPANRIFAGPFGSFVFDFGFYLNRWTGTDLASTFAAPPQVILSNIAINDVNERNLAGVAQLAQFLPIIVESIRATLPTVPILFFFSATGTSDRSDLQWNDGWRAAQQTIVGIVAGLRAAGDTNVYLVNTHAAQTRELGFTFDAGTTDPATGWTASGMTDTVHYNGPNRSITAEMLAAAIVNVT